MSDMDLFTQKPVLAFEKVANASLDEDTSSWPREILTELHRTTPETSDYTPRVAMMKIDEEQGYGLGVVIIESTTDSALAVAKSGPATKRVLIPIIIRGHELAPLDLIMTRAGRLVPLNGHRLREALFRPEVFDMITEDYGDTTLYNMFYPPGRSDNDFGAGISQGIGGGTQGSVSFIQGPGMKMGAEFPLLRSLLPSLLGPDIDAVAKTAGDPSVHRNGSDSFIRGLGLIAAVEKTAMRNAGPLMDVALDTVPSDVIQMGYDTAEGAYWMKRASRALYVSRPVTWMNRGEALKFAGEEVLAKVDTEGAITVSPNATASGGVDPEASKWELVTRPGIYKVKTVHGKEMVGWVIPNLLDVDGTRMPMSVFTNGAAAMVQDGIVGAHVAMGVDLPSAAAKGTGCFYVAGQGGVEATVPLLVEGANEGLDGERSFMVRSFGGETSLVRLVPGLLKMEALKGEFHLPTSARFLPLNEEGMTPLIDRVDQVAKTASDLSKPSITLNGGDGDFVSLQFNRLPKLAAHTDRRLACDDAVFVLCLAGTDAKTAHDRVAEALGGKTVKVSGLVDVRPAQELIQQTHKTASTRSREVRALQRDLVKEAAVLPDTMTVDAVLSLGFINSENVRVFASSIPYLERCLSRVCELLLGSRVGLREIPEFATARAARSLDEVIQGLKALALRDASEDASAGS